MAKLVSKVYGDALFSLAVEEGKLELLREEAEAVRQAVTENPEVLSVLCHPELSQEKKISMIDEMFGKDMSEEMMGFLNVLVRKGRIRELLPVFEYCETQGKEYLKIGVVEVSTPFSLSDSQKDQVEKKLLAVTQYETLEIRYQIDESLLGGMVIRIGDRVLDNSIRSKMEAMSRQLSKVRLSS